MPEASDTGTRRALAATLARSHAIPESLFLALIAQESGWNEKAISPKGAFGLAQLMPATARALGVDRYDPAENLAGGARYLTTQFARFGSWPLALAAYNAGPGAVERHGGIPPFPETRAYVARIMAATGEPGAASPAASTAASTSRSVSVWEF